MTFWIHLRGKYQRSITSRPLIGNYELCLRDSRPLIGCSNILMSDRICILLMRWSLCWQKEFQVYHQKSTPYHSQANGMVQAVNKLLENALMKVCNAQRNDWDVRVPMVLWDYITTCKKMTSQTPFWLVYGIEAVMSMEYIVSILCITTFIGMMDRGALEERLTQLTELEEDRFLAGFHQQVTKERENAWHDQHIKMRTFKVNDLVLLYDSKFNKIPGKFRMHYLGPRVIK